MIKNYFFRISIVIILIVAKCFIWNCNSQTHPKKTHKEISNWKIYTNKKLGFKFKYPASWVIQTKDGEIIDKSGSTKEIQIQFGDTVLKTSLLIEYLLPPNSSIVMNSIIGQYNIAKQSHNTSSKKIKIDGAVGVETSNIFYKDGKGHILIPPLKSINVDFLDERNGNGIELQFKTPLTNQLIEIRKLRQLVSSFKFIRD